MADATAADIAREKMVDSQVRPNQVNDRRVIAAMRALRREDFVPAGALAYADADIDLGGGRYLLSPMVTARLVQLVLANSPASVLVVGAGSGYAAALLESCDVHVVALEEEARLRSGATPPGVDVVSGKLTAGWPAGGPYDTILIEGAVQDIPDIFAAQLTPNGRVVTILADSPEPGGIGRAVIAESTPAGFAVAKMFDCTARPLPMFCAAPAFSF